MVLFFGGLPLALLVLLFCAALSSVFFKQFVVRVVLLFGPLAPRLAASAVDYCCLPDSPLALSFETLGLH